MSDPPPPDLDDALAQLGYAAFRPGQRDAIEALLGQGTLLLVAPTGGGKSLCYQLPAVALPGVALVISPLVALMQDQVLSLQARGVSATYLAATLEGDEVRARMAAIGRGEHKLVYVAPERLAFPGFRSLLARMPLSLVAVDEAHCISEWGHDFRPEYLMIGELLRELQPPRIMACTATATPVVRDEILARLGLPAETPQLVHGFARPNLSLRVAELRFAKEREHNTDSMLALALGSARTARGAAIVYAPTRRGAQEEATRLSRLGWKVAAYHAGMDGGHREQVLRDFSDGSLDVVVATNAFGMGIDRGDVRAVIHLAPPGSIEAYYQEVGRAGRDGEPAWGLMMVAPSDLPLRRRLLERDIDDRAPDPTVVEHKWSMFLELMRWAEGGSCRHDAILRYFGDEAETLHGCGRCDVCEHIGGDAVPDAEVELVVRKALSAVARVHGRFGLQTAARLLLGVDDPRLERSGLAQTRTFGALSERSDAWITKLLRRCISAGWVDFHGDERPVALLTELGREVMTGRRPARLLLPGDDVPLPRRSEGGRRGEGRGRAAADGVDLDPEAVVVFEALRRHRMDRARAEGVPPYVVASDRTLREIAMLRPRTSAELSMAHGIGPAKLERYGAGLLAAVAAARGPG
ncbi:MAG: RecQ family ATP-dependent DNA helicase [Nannocystaceae bacterium]